MIEEEKDYDRSNLSLISNSKLDVSVPIEDPGDLLENQIGSSPHL